MIFKNSVTLYGELAEKGEIIYSKEQCYLNFVLKVKDIRNGEVVKDRMFSVACCGNSVTAMIKKAKTGMNICVEGRLKDYCAKKRDGSVCYYSTVIADKIVF
jgi:single-stranded DNA-binding protein